MRRINRQEGFTLIEVIVVLILVGIMSAVAGMGLVAGVQGYLFAKDNAAVSEKAQLAMLRIYRELSYCDNCTGTSGDVGTFTQTQISGQRTIQLNGSNIVISDGASTDILMDNVGAFSMTYDAEHRITVTIRSSLKPGGAAGAVVPDFVTVVYPRNI